MGYRWHLTVTPHNRGVGIIPLCGAQHKRKNWLFSDTVKGAKASANIYSLIETAKANSLEPYHYLRYVFKELPKAETLDQIEKLLPFNVEIQNLTDTKTPR